ncbi:MAG: hypothetical protein IPG53_14745 [Ignavibacteriales bacterium]|nr:hypothetical protein [Ignavibacteriales bacterium]
MFFNYGHFRSMPNSENLYLLRRNTTNNGKLPDLQIQTIHFQKQWLASWVSEHNLGDMFLLRLAGYYKDVSDESRLVGYISQDNPVSYSVPEPNMYCHICGFEVTLTKNRGEWITGFVNYTYMVASSRLFCDFQPITKTLLFKENLKETQHFFDQVKLVPQPAAEPISISYTNAIWP